MADTPSPQSRRRFLQKTAGGVALFHIAPAAVLGWLVMTRPVESIAIPVEVTIKQLGHGLLGSYFLPFELISVILMVAMSGAVLLTWEKRGQKNGGDK